ncbi:MAG: hypothetical protein F4X02_00275 [Chloroflexi bacterium]|nr:hypothetical protein [Chloroflexota bacterium]
MPLSAIRAAIFALAFVCATVVMGQEFPPISAANLAGLRSYARIDFADMPGELQIGWFEANADASEFLVFDRAGKLYRVSAAGVQDSWSYVESDGDQLFALIDAAYIDAEAHALYRLDDGYFINEQQLDADYEPLALSAFDGSLFVETLDADRQTFFRQYSVGEASSAWQFAGETPLPAADPQTPAVRIGRIDFPLVLYSSLQDGGLRLYRFPEAFAPATGRDFKLQHGPAVFGAVNGAAGSHFAFSDPFSARLNLLDLATGEGRVVAEIGGSYAQYHLLTADASAILIVNLDFAPEVFAWDTETGQRFNLGPYRSCGRIPDKVALSADGRALIIGCDTGLDIWRVSENEDNGEG